MILKKVFWFQSTFFRGSVSNYHPDYYPFGMVMPDRDLPFDPDGEDYRYAYNGMEMDKEVSGNGNSYTTEFRQYDPRLGRWKSLDPLMAKFPWMSPYVAFNDNPMFYVDPNGLEGQDWVRGGIKANGERAPEHLWHWREDVHSLDDAILKAGALEYKPVGSYVYAHIDDDQTVALAYLGDANARYIDEVIVSPSLDGVSEPECEDCQGIQQSFSSTMNPSDGFSIGDPEALENAWGADSDEFANIIHKTILFIGAGVGGGVLLEASAPLLPYLQQGASWLASNTGNAARLYHNTFGKNGGYANILFEGTVQAATNLGGDVEWYGLAGSALIPGGTSIWKQVAFETSTSYIQVTSSKGIEFRVINGLSTAHTINNTISTSYGLSKYGNKFMDGFSKITGRIFIDAAEKSAEK